MPTAWTQMWGEEVLPGSYDMKQSGAVGVYADVGWMGDVTSSTGCTRKTGEQRSSPVT